MEKGYDGLFDLTYDFNIDLSNTLKDQDFNRVYDFTVISAKFLYEKKKAFDKLKKQSDREIREFVYSTDALNLDERFFKPESVKDNSKGEYFFPKSREILFDRLSRKEAFSKIKAPLMVLARKGFEKAISLYLKCEDKANWDSIIYANALQIANKTFATPEEWEVAASLKFYDVPSEGVKNMKELAMKVQQQYRLNFDACCEGMEELYDRSRKEFLRLYKVYTQFRTKNEENLKKKNEEKRLKEYSYAEALQKAMLGYYAKYFSGKMPYASYLQEYLRLSCECENLLADENAFKHYSRGIFYTKEKICDLLSKIKVKHEVIDLSKKYNLKEAFEILLDEMTGDKQDEGILDRFAVATVKALYSSKTSLNEIKNGFFMLNEIGQHRFLSEDLKKESANSPLFVGFGAVKEKEI